MNPMTLAVIGPRHSTKVGLVEEEGLGPYDAGEIEAGAAPKSWTAKVIWIPYIPTIYTISESGPILQS